MIKIGDYNKIMSDKELFYNTVYTPFSVALKTFEERQKNNALLKKMNKLLESNIPEPLKKLGTYGVQSRQLATPNHDTRWFLDLIKGHGLKPIFLEYYEDKLTSNNNYKYSLGMLRIHEKINKKGEDIEEKINVVNFCKDDGKKIKDISTILGKPLVNFHHGLFNALNLDKADFCFYDASDWFKKNGPAAKDYYTNFLLLFVCHGIFFENFLLSGDEGVFTRTIFLPAFERAWNLSGEKPLIVPIPPMDSQDDPHWFSYDQKIKQYIKS